VSLEREAVDAALRRVVEFLDYDLHKQLECDEETGEDMYGEHVDRFIAEYGEMVG
jgi:Arc/MetJ family transcription regulator